MSYGVQYACNAMHWVNPQQPKEDQWQVITNQFLSLDSLNLYWRNLQVFFGESEETDPIDLIKILSSICDIKSILAYCEVRSLYCYFCTKCQFKFFSLTFLNSLNHLH